ncbi:MAG: DUF4271 domain-containing protein [Prevotella sp.]|nr:DUF4271 domain-containing protein [Prevotella sp.]
MSQADSIARAHGANFVTKGNLTLNFQGRSPYQVIKNLPKNATEAQKDSAIQANFKPGKIEYNTRVDTLTTFGLKVVKPKELSEMKFAEESFFAGSEYFHPEKGMAYDGVAGDPVPYTVANDHMVTSLLLGCFILAVLAFSIARDFIFRQAKNFFYMPRRVADMAETATERRFQYFLILQAALLLGISYYIYTRAYMGRNFFLDSQLAVVGIFAGVFAVYFFLKGILYHIVDWVFFERKKNEQFWRSQLFLIAVEGIVLFPLVMLQIYFNLSMPVVLVCALFVIVLVKILTFYKAFVIFFKRTAFFLQIFLYFCALEMMPLAALWGILTMTSDYLEIKF